MTETRVILAGQAVRALASESTVESFDLDSISAVVLDEGVFQSTLTLTTNSGDVTVDNMTSAQPAWPPHSETQPPPRRMTFRSMPTLRPRNAARAAPR